MAHTKLSITCLEEEPWGKLRHWKLKCRVLQASQSGTHGEMLSQSLQCLSGPCCSWEPAVINQVSLGFTCLLSSQLIKFKNTDSGNYSVKDRCSRTALLSTSHLQALHMGSILRFTEYKTMLYSCACPTAHNSHSGSLGSKDVLTITAQAEDQIAVVTRKSLAL